MRGIRLTYATSAALLAMIGVGCSHEIESPAVKANTVAPDLVCTEQLTTTVILTGDGFTPAPEQTLTDKSILVLPAITLDRTVDLTGAAQSGSFKIPDNPKNPAASRVTWQSEQQMSFQVFPELALQPGLYNVTVTNPDDKQKAVFEGGLAAVPAPTIEKIEPDIACNDQADQTFKLTGTTLLDVGGTLPVVHVGDKDFPASAVSDCIDVPGKHAAGTVQSCTSATANGSAAHRDLRDPVVDRIRDKPSRHGVGTILQHVDDIVVVQRCHGQRDHGSDGDVGHGVLQWQRLHANGND